MHLILGKQATMSSVKDLTQDPNKAVDGIYATESGDSLAHSENEVNPWWRVDLGGAHCIWAINVLNRGMFLTLLNN